MLPYGNQCPDCGWVHRGHCQCDYPSEKPRIITAPRRDAPSGVEVWRRHHEDFLWRHAMKSWQTSIGKEAAIAMVETKWWEGKTAREIVEFQLFTAELCMPFGDFHLAVEQALGRPVWTHEFAFLDHIRDEFLGEKPAPTMQDILRLIPEEKRILVVVTE